MKPIRITRHARNRMRPQRHGITETIIIETVRALDIEEPSVAGRVNRWTRVEERVSQSDMSG